MGDVTPSFMTVILHQAVYFLSIEQSNENKNLKE